LLCALYRRKPHDRNHKSPEAESKAGQAAMTWYAVKTKPGAQIPQREYAVETTRSSKGYRIVPSLDPKRSAIERALSDEGFVHYMPSEKRLIRDRRHAHLWKPRRVALLVGYIFVLDPVDWRRLEDIPGVAGVLRSGDGKPLPVDIVDILTLRSIEAVAEELFDRQAHRAVATLRSKAKRDPRLKAIVEKLNKAGELLPNLPDVIAA
jgi:transcription antitermination factor NusG